MMCHVVIHSSKFACPSLLVNRWNTYKSSNRQAQPVYLQVGDIPHEEKSKVAEIPKIMKHTHMGSGV